MSELGSFASEAIRQMNPIRKGEFAFCRLTHSEYESTHLRPLCFFREDEGVTVILPVPEARAHGFSVVWIGTQITLSVNTSLDGVGFLAAVAIELAQAGIAVNAFSPISHDDLFVKPSDADLAMTVLCEMMKR